MAALILVTACGSVAPAQISMRFEAPGVQASTVTGTSVANFTVAVPGASSSTALLTVGPNGPAGTFSAGGTVSAAGQYGGAGGTGNYVSVPSSSTMTLSLAGQAGYLGFWWSAADTSNVVTFKQGTSTVGVFNSASLLNSGLLTPGTYNPGTGTGGHFGNPTTGFAGQNNAQAYVFVNFYATGAADKFDSVVFSQAAGGGFEFDNLTAYSQTIGSGQQSGTPGGVIPVPEPAGILAAAGGVVALLRWRRTAPTAA